MSDIIELAIEIIDPVKTEFILFGLAIFMHVAFFGSWRSNKTQSNKSKKGLSKKHEALRACMLPSAKAGHSQQLASDTSHFVRPTNSNSCARIIGQIKQHGEEGHLDQALAVFRSYGERTTSVFNAMIDTCVECQDYTASEGILKEALEAGMVDIISYNSIIKSRIRCGQMQAASAALECLRKQGLQPNHVTFHELLTACCKTKEGLHGRDAWRIVDQMKACGLLPTGVTCSILLNHVQQSHRPGTQHGAPLERIAALIEELDGETDDILLGSMVEACVRSSRSDLLNQYLKSRSAVAKPTNVHAYGSFIRAFGFINDVDAVWNTWKEMRTQQVQMTSVTLGCMVEALSTNGQTEAAYELIREMLDCESTKALVNTIIYCSVLKGFSQSKNFERVWRVYKEMTADGFVLTIVTWNTLVDACARCREMSYIPTIMSAMGAAGVEPNVITYGAILKGYCQDNKMEKAFEFVDHMNATTSFRLDEIMYNTLLDGCARQGLVERGMQLLADMRASNVAPTNFTLSVLVKLASRGKQLDLAFELCREISKERRFRLNVHVYGNLVQACISHGELNRAFAVLEEMVANQVRLDVRTYRILMQNCVVRGRQHDAEALLRAACGLPQPHASLAGGGANVLQPAGGLPRDLIKEILEAVAISDEKAGMHLAQHLKRGVRGFNLDQQFMMRLATSAACRDSNRHPWRR